MRGLAGKVEGGRGESWGLPKQLVSSTKTAVE